MPKAAPENNQQPQDMVPDPNYFVYPRDPYGNFYYDQYGVVVIDSRNGRRVIPIIQQLQPQEMIPDPRFFVQPTDMYGNFYYDQYGVVVIDSRNGRRVIPNGMTPIPQQTPPPVKAQPQPQTKSVKDSLKDEFEIDEEFFLLDSEKTKKPGGNDMLGIADGFFNNVAPAEPNPLDFNFPSIDVLSKAQPINVADKPRYTISDMRALGMSDIDLAKHLLDKAFANHPDLRYQLFPATDTLGTINNSSVTDINRNVSVHELIILKDGIKVAKFYCDLKNYAGVGLPVMHGIVGKQFKDNHIVVPLTATHAVEECITNAAYNRNFGVDAVTEAIFKRDMLPDYIYGTIDMSNCTPGDGQEVYQLFGKQIERIDKYYPLNVRYRLEDWRDNNHFCLISDGWVAPFNGVKTENLNTAIILDGNKLTIREPSGNTEIMMGE